MGTLKQIIMQEANEERYSRKFIDGLIRKDILSSPVMVDRISQGVGLLEQYTSKDYYQSKMKRIAQLEGLDFELLVIDIFVGISYYQHPELLSSVSAQMASRLKFSDRVEGITTIAEILAVLCITDAFDIEKADRTSSLMVVSRVLLSDSTKDFIEHSAYLPPMICTPLTLTTNYSSGYLTHNDSLILGQGNHHSGDICLDVLNLMNNVPLKLNTEFLSTVEEEPTFDISNPLQKDLWMSFKRQSYNFYSLLVQQGNKFYMTHKVDKRGRIYASGYHINTMGTSFKKAAVELSNQELVTGVPTL